MSDNVLNHIRLLIDSSQLDKRAIVTGTVLHTGNRGAVWLSNLIDPGSHTSFVALPRYLSPPETDGLDPSSDSGSWLVLPLRECKLHKGRDLVKCCALPCPQTFAWAWGTRGP